MKRSQTKNGTRANISTRLMVMKEAADYVNHTNHREYLHQEQRGNHVKGNYINLPHGAAIIEGNCSAAIIHENYSFAHVTSTVVDIKICAIKKLIHSLLKANLLYPALDDSMMTNRWVGSLFNTVPRCNLLTIRLLLVLIFMLPCFTLTMASSSNPTSSS